MDLEARFIDFLRSLSGAEFIDDFSPDIFDGEKRADFLLDFRRVVLELKTLKQDPSYKVAEHLKQYVNLPEFPIFLWNANIDDVVSPLSNGHEIKRKIFDALTRTIQTSVEKADDQIESTKKRLGLTNSSGILSILNEGVAILTPDVIAKRVSEILHNRFKGKVRYGNISHVLLISESHIVNTGGQQFTGSLITVEGPTARANVEAGNYLELLSEKWGQYCSAPIYFSPNHSFAGMEFEDWVRTKGNSSPGHHSWVQEYWRRPYLRHLSDDEFVATTARVFESVRLTLSDDRKIASLKSSNELTKIQQEWSDCLEEAAYRKFDMKRIQSRLSYPIDGASFQKSLTFLSM